MQKQNCYSPTCDQEADGSFVVKDVAFCSYECAYKLLQKVGQTPETLMGDAEGAVGDVTVEAPCSLPPLKKKRS